MENDKDHGDLIGMTDSYNTELFRNIESPFTELFSLLKHKKILSNELRLLTYNSDELKVLYQHAGNAIDILLYGLQDLGGLINIVSQSKFNKFESLANIGLFISAMGNLTEALNGLRADAGFLLKQKNVIDF